MSMERIIVGLIVGIFQGLAGSYAVLNQIKIENKINILKFIIIMCLYGIIGFFIIPNNIRFLVFLLVIFLCLYFVLGIKNKNVILYAFNCILIFLIPELIVTLILVIFGIDSVDLVNNNLYNLLANILISVLSIVLIKLPFIKKIISIKCF